MQVAFEPRERPKGANPGERGWIKPGSGPGAGHPLISMRAGSGSTERTLMEFYITQCADETLPVPTLKHYAEAPGGSFVFDARYLVENAPGGDREAARANLRAISEAYEWWKEHRRTERVVFFCVSGQNRSVTSSLVFALSLIGELELASSQRRASRAAPWSIRAITSGIDEPLEFDGAQGTLVHYLLRLVHEIRPQAFSKKGAKPWSAQLASAIVSSVPGVKKDSRTASAIGDVVEEEAEPVLDYARLWVGHDDNRNILWMLDATVRARLYADWWEGERWLSYELPPRLVAARIEPEKGRERKRKELASGKSEAEDSADRITLL